MKTNKSFLALVISLLIFSCSQEKELIEISENISTIESQETPLKRNPAPIEAFPLPLAAATLSPCGLGFTVSITWFGAPGGGAGSYPYEIRPLGGGVPLDSGMISDGMNTTWVLAPCTAYEFSFWWGGASPATQVVTTDGCGGIFVC